MRIQDCYSLLEVSPQASDDEVKAAHRDLARVWHPDRFAHDAPLRVKAEEKLKAINEAYETVMASRAGRFRGSFRDQAPPRASGAENAARAESVRRGYVARNRSWAITCAAAAIFFLFRRPTPGGLAIALVLFVLAAVFVTRMRAASS